MNTKRKLINLSLVLALCVSFLLPAFAATPDQSAQSAAKTVLEASQAVSLQYALLEGDTITRTGDVLSKDAPSTLSPDLLYGIGSVSKIYTAVSVMKLVEAGKVKLDTPLTQYIPEFTMADPRYKNITVRMLLNHSSGLNGSSLKDGILFGDSTPYAKDALLARLKNQTLKADPGAYSVYCNDGFTLAEILVEKVTGKSFTAYVHETITKPLGLTATFTPADTLAETLFAPIYYGTAKTPREHFNLIGTGGMYATAKDLATFGKVFYSSKLLSQASLDAMAAPEYANGFWPNELEKSLSFGLGWDNTELVPFKGAGIQALCKGGDTLGYHASFVVLPEHKMAAAVVSSGGSSAFNQMLASRLLIDALAQKGIVVNEALPALPSSSPAAMPASEMAKAGYYGSTLAAMKINISADGKMTMPDMPDLTLRYYTDGSFRDQNNTLLFQFVTAENGITYLYQLTYMQLPGLPSFANTGYIAQQLKPRDLPADVWQSLKGQNDLLYFALNEHHRSVLYLFQSMTTVPIYEENDGYVGGLAIMDANTISPITNVPGGGSRDYQYLSFVTDGGKHFLKANDYLYLREDSVPTVYPGTNALCTIQPDGYARWCAIGDAKDLKMNVKIPENGSFYVYSPDGIVTASSIFDQRIATLPAGGYLVFLGDPGARFHISIS